MQCKAANSGDENGPKMAHLKSNFLRGLQKMYAGEKGRELALFLFHRDENDKKKFALSDLSASHRARPKGGPQVW